MPPSFRTQRGLTLSGHVPYVVLAVVGIALYANTLRNAYVFDDRPLYTQNTYVQQGWKGIPTLLTSDIFRSLYEQQGVHNVLAGGRYRPLSQVTFAMEVGLVGQRAWFSHLINILLYTLTILVLYRFLSTHLTQNNTMMAFAVTLLFTVHPIHSEVVANVKSRDEMMSLLFMLLCLGTSLRSLNWTVFLFVLALLSKEYGVVLLILIPVFQHMHNQHHRIAKTMLCLVLTFTAYLGIRTLCVGWGGAGKLTILDAPYAYATELEAWATKLLVLMHDLKLLLWPHPMAYDYSYAQLPYTNFTNPWVWISIVVHLVLAITGTILAWRKSAAGFAILFYLGTLLLVSNLVINAGAVMGARMLFHPSLGFCILIGYFAISLNRHMHFLQRPVWVLVTLLTILACTKVVQRNADWKDDVTLYIRDAEAVPNSALVQCNAGARHLDLYYAEANATDRKKHLDLAISRTCRGLAIYPEDGIALLNLGTMMFERGHYKRAEELWKNARTQLGHHPKIRKGEANLVATYYFEGEQAARVGNFPHAEISLRHAVRLDPSHQKAWLALGGVYIETNRPDEAKDAWRHVSEPLIWTGFEPVSVFESKVAE